MTAFVKKRLLAGLASLAVFAVINSAAYGQGHGQPHYATHATTRAARPSTGRSSHAKNTASRHSSTSRISHSTQHKRNAVSHSPAGVSGTFTGKGSGLGALGGGGGQFGLQGGMGGGGSYGGSGSSGGQLGHQGGFGGLGGGLGGFGGGQPYGGGGIPANRSVAQLSAQDQLRATYEANYRSAMAHGQPPPQYGSLPQFPENNGSWGDAILQALPHSGGVQVGVAGEASDPGGSLNIAGTSAMGGGVFWDPQKGWSTGDYASAGGLAKGPGSSGDGTGVAGTSGSAGASFWISNATSNTGLQNTNNNNLQLQRGHRADSRIHFGCDGR